ncbi:FAD-dependent oxidoreductase [uncultured Friedmanniella sp.]|uniref:GcvT family protein n=1 Tax=uncultured Friedmanniella sp. TaxID=335381 RepID=UPI0035CB3FEA
MVGPKVVIIGAGIVGASLADELTARGWTDVTVLDAGPLPAAGGSTSHAPGVVFQTNGAKIMSDFARYTVEKLSSLSWQGEPCYLPVGGLEIATTPERARELQRRFGFAQSWGVVGAELLDADESVRRFDLLAPDTVLGGLYVPDDGVAKAVRAVSAQLDRAVERGATVRDRTQVLDVLTAGDKVTGVRTDQSEIAADVVVCCAGLWGQQVATMVGQRLALTPLAHQFAWTGPVAPLAGRTAEAIRPVLRHQDADLYYRENGTTFGIGSYRHRPMPVRPQDLAAWSDHDEMNSLGGQPSVLPFTPEDFAFPLEETRRILPSLFDERGELELADPFNGVFSFTVDNLPLLGPHATLDGFWTAEAVWITHSAGVARAMAEWLVDGRPRVDLHACDVNRFEVHQLAPAWIEATNSQNFVEVYDILHPLQPPEHGARGERSALRPLRTSPFYAREAELGAVFLPASGWERPQWYEANAALLDSPRNVGWHVPQPDAWAAHLWSPVVAAEAAITRTDVALYDMTALKRLEVTGPGATEFLQSMVTGTMDKSVGAVTYCLLLDAAGGIRSDVTVARLGPERFQVGANGPLDLDWLIRHLRDSAWATTVQVRDLTPGTCCIGIWGPNARDVVQPLTDADFSHAGFRYFRAQECYLGNVPVTAMRLSYVGELGYELYTTADQGLALWDLLMAAGAEHGIIAAGRGAFNALRIEKGYRSSGTDMTPEHGPDEAGLSFAVRPELPFFGRDGLRARPPADRRLCLLSFEAPNGIVLGSEPVYPVGAPDAVGYVTSAAYAYTLGLPLAYAWLPVALAAPGSEVEVGWFDRRYRAVVTAEPAFDPEMKKIKC